MIEEQPGLCSAIVASFAVSVFLQRVDEYRDVTFASSVISYIQGGFDRLFYGFQSDFGIFRLSVTFFCFRPG